MTDDVKGRCPACGRTGYLFVGSGGYVTCSIVECPDPGLAADLLMGNHTLFDSDWFAGTFGTELVGRVVTTVLPLGDTGD